MGGSGRYHVLLLCICLFASFLHFLGDGDDFFMSACFVLFCMLWSATRSRVGGMGMHGFQMLLRINIIALITTAVVCSMELNAMVCVRSTVLIAIHQGLISATVYEEYLCRR